MVKKGTRDPEKTLAMAADDADAVNQGRGLGPSSNTKATIWHKLKAVLPPAFSIVVLLGFAIYLYLNADRFRRLLDISVTSILLLIGLTLAAIFVRGLVNYLFYRQMGTSIRLREGIGLSIINTVSNQLPFAGGMIAKGVYLKMRHKVAYTRFMSATIALYVCYLSSSGVVGLGVLAHQFFRGHGMPLPLVLGFAGMAASASLFELPFNISALPDKWRQRVAQLANGWQILKENRLLLGELISLQITLTVLAAGRFWIAFHALSQDVMLAHCILFSAASTLTRLVSISPGGLGVREAIVASVASVLGFDMDASAVAVGLDRLVSTPVNIALGPIFTYILSREVADAQLATQPRNGRGEQAS
jgi:uncharacterized membrane protein YbhN (UPF0104 family)